MAKRLKEIKKYSSPFPAFIPPVLVVCFGHLWKICPIFYLILTLILSQEAIR